MVIHEFQVKELFREFAVLCPRGKVAASPEQASQIAGEINYPCVIKAQVHAGGRGKAGGVKIVNSPAEAKKTARKMIGMKLFSPQTGMSGKTVRTVLIEECLKIKKELYLALIVDRECESPVMIVSTEGGMEIEEVAAKNPELIHRIVISPITGLASFHSRNLAFKLDLNAAQQKEFFRLAHNLYRLFIEKDASLIEINPLILTDQDEIIALDGKINFDDNALFRHPEILALRDPSEEEPLEAEASRYDLSYIKLDGNIGCMVNGAGLAMATMDILKFYGGNPANFLDVGGGTSLERVRRAFKILLSDPDVKVVFVNIFGGIVRTDLVAGGIVQAVRDIELKTPIVIRLVGTNEEEGRRIIGESGIPFIQENDLAKAARKSVRLVQGA